MCCEAKLASGKTKAKAQKVAKCVDAANGQIVRHACYASPFAPDACSFDATNACATLVVQETVNIPSAAAARRDAGQPGRGGDQPEAAGAVRRQQLQPEQRPLHAPLRSPGRPQQPDAILVLVPGFEGGAGDFKILAENLIARAHGAGLVLEVWAFDRRSNQLEDMVGLDIAEEFAEPADRARLAVRRRAEPDAAPAAGRGPEPPRGVLRHAGRRAVHRQLDATWSSRATSTRSSTRRAPSRRTRTSSSAATRRAPASPPATPRPTST